MDSYQELCESLLTREENHLDDQKKLLKLVEVAQEPTHLEGLGKELSDKHFAEVLFYLFHHPHMQPKLSPILVGLSPSVFLQSLLHLSPDLLSVLKQESLSEPLQHQLTLFKHDCERLIIDMDVQITKMEKDIGQLQTLNLTYTDLNEIEGKIESFRVVCEERLQGINQALAITWNTNRIDLIDLLTKLKEQCHFLIKDKIGFSQLSPTGLYLNLQQHLHAVFNGHPLLEEEALKDEDSALEGLTKFSIWYLEDYWNLGLLPHISDPHQSELKSKKYSEQKKMEQRQSLFTLVQNHLDQLQIGTVGDLKKARIFSKSMLEEYIAQNKHRLKGQGTATKAT